MSNCTLYELETATEGKVTFKYWESLFEDTPYFPTQLKASAKFWYITLLVPKHEIAWLTPNFMSTYEFPAY